MKMLNRAGRPPSDDQERGAVAVLVAASLVMLMGFAALAVDTGAAFSERRQDQSAADMASMVAVQFARGSANPATAANNGANQAIAVANSSLDFPGAADWGACTDPSRPAKFTRVSGVSACVSFTANLQEARVVIPTIEVDTSFGAVVGRESIATSAMAEAKADLGQPGRVLPFGLPSGATGVEVCLRTAASANMTPPPCDGPEEGNFGTLDFSFYENPTIGTVQECNPNPQRGLSTNMVAGVDHPLGTKDGEVREDGAYCPVWNARPNHVYGQTGGGSNLDDGMINGTAHYLTSSKPGRLARGTNLIEVVRNVHIDNKPIWDYIAGSSLPGACGGVTDTAGMEACIAAWRANPSGPLFDISIGSAVRFGAVPKLDANEFFAGRTLYGIVDIVPVYIQGTFWRCTGNGNCTTVHFPGDPGASSGLGSTVNGNGKISAVTAFVLHRDMLPEPLRSNFPSSPEQVDYTLVK
jgi:hypothetical protein